MGRRSQGDWPRLSHELPRRVGEGSGAALGPGLPPPDFVSAGGCSGHVPSATVTFCRLNVHFKSQMGDPLAVQWVRSHLQRRGHGFDPWSRKILPAAGQQSRRARTIAPALCTPRATATEARESHRATTEPMCYKDESHTPKARDPQRDAAAVGSPAPD